MKIKVIFLIPVFILLLSSATSAQDFSYDKKIGAESAIQVEQMVGIYHDSLLTAYIDDIGQRLVDALGDPPVDFRFFAVDMAEPNAFALPGGYIYVSRGLLSLVNNEAELACVMGHEIIHVTKRHSVKQMRKSILPGLLHIPGAVVGVFNPNLGNLINTPISLGSELFLSNYSRRQETESDKLGIKLASQAGYDPSKLAIILDNLAKDVELLTGEAEKKSYFSSHPYTPKRLEKIEKELPNLNWQEKPYIAGDKPSLYAKLDGMYVGLNPQQGIFKEGLFLHADLELAIKFPKKWNTVNMPIAVGAVQPDGEAQIVFLADDPGPSPDSIGKAFSKVLREKYDIKPTKDQSIDINGFEAYELALTDRSGETPVDYQLYWIKTDEVLFNVMGASYTNHTESVAAIVNSFRRLADDEKSTISGTRLRIAMALEGETLEQLSDRTGNVWDMETTAVKNQISPEARLQESQPVKIAVEETYLPN
jgi:predicted Zn-dependent protease